MFLIRKIWSVLTLPLLLITLLTSPVAQSTETAELISKNVFVFEKALLAILLLSYIQPFTDGNKRTSRIVSNALLIANKYCPLSFRSVDSLKYKEAVLIFYEQNNLSAFKKIFIEQYDFAVSTYF